MSSGKDQSVDLKLSPLSKKKLLESEAPKAIPEDTSDVGFGEDGMPLNPSGGEPTIQFTSPGRDPVNGDAKVEIGANVGVPHFVGLGKEELMKFANDPFWVRLRWILFALFWLIWLAMLVGAIIIIVLAPKCANTNKVLTTGQTLVAKNGPYYEVFLKSFSREGKFAGLEDKMDYIKGLGAKTVIISQFLDTNGQGISEVVDFKKIDASYGLDFDGFKGLVKKFKDAGLGILLQFIPNHSSKNHKWFTEKPEYYVMKSKADFVNNPSNWTNFYGRSAWTPVSSDPEAKYYLHQFHENEPDLNFKNPEVIKEMNGILEYWYSTGVDGFLLSDVSYLSEDLDNLNDQNSTKNQKDNLKIIESLVSSKDWKFEEGQSAPYTLLDLNDVSNEEVFDRYATGNIIPVHADWAALPESFSAIELKNASDDSQHFVLRRLSSPRVKRLETQFGRKRADILAMVSFLLRGEVVIYYGEESGALENSPPKSGLEISHNYINWQTAQTSPQLQYYKDLIQLHHNLDQTAGDSDGGPTRFHTDSEDEPGIFAFTRKAAKNYAVITNVGSQMQKVNLTTALAPPEKATFTVVSLTPGLTAFKKGENITTDAISLDSETGIVLEILDAPKS